MRAFDRPNLLWCCPNCGGPSWPGCDAEGRQRARMCQPCQAASDLVAEEIAAVRRRTEEAR